MSIYPLSPVILSVGFFYPLLFDRAIIILIWSLILQIKIKSLQSKIKIMVSNNDFRSRSWSVFDLLMICYNHWIGVTKLQQNLHNTERISHERRKSFVLNESVLTFVYHTNFAPKYLIIMTVLSNNQRQCITR